MGPDLLLYLIVHLLGAGVCVSRKGRVPLGLAKLCMDFSGMNSLHCKENVKFSYDLFLFALYKQLLLCPLPKAH